MLFFLFQPNVKELDALIEKNRAISTPDKTIMDVTFQAPVDLSVIPLDSPALVPSSLPIRVYSDQDPRKGNILGYFVVEVYSLDSCHSIETFAFMLFTFCMQRLGVVIGNPLQ